MPRRLLTDQRGFTIVEVLVAAVVLAIGLGGAVTMFDTASSTGTTTKAREQGVNLAREIVEDARSIPYAQLTPSSIVNKLQAMPGLNTNNPGPNPGWTIVRRGVTYTVAAGVCSVDDPADGYGVEDPNQFCASTTGKPTTPCSKLLDTGQINGDVNILNQISSTLSGQVSIGACGLDLNLTGQISDLTQAQVALCLGGLCQNQPSTGDPTPDDYKRITVLVTWGVGTGSRYVLQSAAVNNPGLASGPHVQTLAPTLPLTGLFTNTFLGLTIPFTATADASANSVQWSVNGVPQGTASYAAGLWTFSWTIGLTGSGSEWLDGNYTVAATAFDTNGNAGPPLSTTVTLARRVPYAPKNFAGGHDGSFVDFQWAPSKEGDITGYRVYRVGGLLLGLLQPDVLVCSTSNVRATSCQDTNPPASASIQYYVYAVDPEGNGDHSTLTVTTTNLAPNPPTNLQASSSNGNTVLAWTAPSPPDADGDAIDFYRIYRDGQLVANRYDTVPGNVTSYTDTQTGGVQHTYRVTAVDPQLAESTAAGPVIK